MIKKLLLLMLALVAYDATAKRPNIVFILTDDQRFDAMGFMDRYSFWKLRIWIAFATRECI
jgi:hypothetical protein